MTSTIKVNTITTESGSTLTVGGCGKTVALASGASQTGFGRTGTVDWDTSIKVTGDSPITAVSGKGYFLNTSAGTITINLPTSPSAGDIVSIKDYARTFATYNVTVGRGGSNMDGTAADTPLVTNGLSVTFIYMDASKGWSFINDDTTSQAGAVYVAATGGNTTITDGDYKIHVFTGPGTLCVSDAGNSAGSNTVDYLVVAGGGGGGKNSSNPGYDSAGGGGAGGMQYSKSTVPTAHPIANASGVPVTVTCYAVVVGGGGAGSSSCATKGTAGDVSSFHTITSAGGGSGGASASSPLNGGSGGGQGGGSSPGGIGTGNDPSTTPAQGHPGGANAGAGPYSPDRAGGAGGGAGAVGGSVSAGGNSGNATGGIGAYVPGPWFGPTSPTYGQSPAPLAPNGRYFAGGGAGASPSADGVPYGGGDAAGGGGGRDCSATGDVNTGGGGAGAMAGVGGSAGGSGFVAIRYKFQ